MNADVLIPRGWRWRVRLVRHDFGDSAGDLPAGSYTVEDRRTGHRLAAIVPDEVAEPLPLDDAFDIVPGLGMPRSWIVADGNMVTRWYTLDDAVLYAAQARGEWDRPWPFRFRQFWGDRLRYPLTWVPAITALALFAVLWPWSHRGVLVEEAVALLAPLCVLLLLGRLVPGQPEADYAQSDPAEVDGWPDDPRWGPLFDSTVWTAHEEPVR